MAGTAEGHVESIHEGEATPTNDLDDEVEGYAGTPPHLQVEQLKARHQELEEARLQLEQERAELEREIERHGDGGRARAVACDVNRWIVEALEELQLHAPEAHIPGSNQLLGFDYGRLER